MSYLLRKTFFFSVFSFFLALPVSAKTVSVDITDFIFDPQQIEVEVGDRVEWTNLDIAPHQILGDFGESAILQTGNTYGFTFREAGTFDYACKIHPSMTGKVVVVAPGASGGGSGAAASGLVFSSDQGSSLEQDFFEPDQGLSSAPSEPPPRIEEPAHHAGSSRHELAQSGPNTTQIMMLLGLMGMFVLMRKALA